MSGLGIYIPITSASKRMSSSPSSCEWPSKRRRVTLTMNEAPSSTELHWRAIYLQPNSSINRISPPLSTEFVTPPDSCDLNCNPSPSPGPASWAAAAISSSLVRSVSQDTVLLGSTLDLVPAIMSFPTPPRRGDNTPSHSIDSSPSSRASSEVYTPVKPPAPPTCLDTFGKRLDVERFQLSQEPSPIAEGSTISRMLVPRSTWCMFRTFPSSAGANPSRSVVAYRGKDGRGGVVTVENEDLWMDEKNPFLLTPFDLRQETNHQLSGTIIPATSSLNLL